FAFTFTLSGQPAFSIDPPTLQLIETDDPLVLQAGTWPPQTSSSASGGSYLYSSGSQDDGLSLQFTGTSIEIVYVEHAAFGTMAIEIDNTVVRTVITTSEETEFDVRTVVDYLAEGEHTLRVYAASGTIAVDAFYAVPSMVLVWQDNFDEASGWFFGTGEFAAQSATVSQALKIGSDANIAYLKSGGWVNLNVQVHFSIQSGNFAFNTRLSAAGH